MKRKLSTSSVAVFAPEFVVPRVPVRHRSYVVPGYRARPHGTAKKLLRVASVSELRVVLPQAEVEEVESERSSRMRSLSCDNGVPDSPVTVSASLSASQGERPNRYTAPARLGVRSRNAKGKSSPERKHNPDQVWYSSRLEHKIIDFSLSFSSRRVRIAGSVDDAPVNSITVDTATDVSVVSLAWVRSHPTLRGVPLDPIPPAAVALRAANGEPINVVGFIGFPLTLSELTRTVTALIVLSLGLHLMLLDNSFMSDFGARLDWEIKLCPFRLLVERYKLFIAFATPARRSVATILPRRTTLKTCRWPSYITMLMPFLSLCVRESTSNRNAKALLLPTLIVYRQKTALLLSDLAL